MVNFKHDEELIQALVCIVTDRKNEGLTIEQMLTQSGIAGVSIYSRAETRAKVLYQLEVGVTPAERLTPSLAEFIADYPVFRWSELRYRFQSDLEQDIETVLQRFRYRSRYLEQEREYVWAPKRMWTLTVRKHLRARKPLGDSAYLDYLTNK